MKIAFMSDVHGVPSALATALSAADSLGFDRLVLLGDLLYHETFFLTHGHLWNENRLPPLGMGTVLAHGHTHVPELKRLGCGVTIFNPGSVSLPKGGSARSFGYFDGERLTHVTI